MQVVPMAITASAPLRSMIFPSYYIKPMRWNLRQTINDTVVMSDADFMNVIPPPLLGTAILLVYLL